MKFVVIVAITLLSQEVIFAMSKPKPGASASSIEFGSRSQMTAQNAPWMNGYRLGLNASPFLISIEQGFLGESPATRYFGFTFGLGSGPFNLPPGFYQLQPYGKLNDFSPRWRDGQFASYSGIELGLSQRVVESWGWFASVSIEYPGILMVPSVAFKTKEEIRNRDGLVTFFNLGIVFGSKSIE